MTTYRPTIGRLALSSTCRWHLSNPGMPEAFFHKDHQSAPLQKTSNPKISHLLLLSIPNTEVFQIFSQKEVNELVAPILKPRWLRSGFKCSCRPIVKCEISLK